MTVKWPYPWTPEEDPNFEDPDTGLPNSQNPEYYSWFQAMREKYGYPRERHVKNWLPRFKDWRKTQ